MIIGDHLKFYHHKMIIGELTCWDRSLGSPRDPSGINNEESIWNLFLKYPPKERFSLVKMTRLLPEAGGCTR